MISKLATLALASSVIMMYVPVAQGRATRTTPPGWTAASTSLSAADSAEAAELQTVIVSFFLGERCVGPSIQYSPSSLTSSDSCDTSCQDLDDYLSVSIVDPLLKTTCYIWQVPGCAGNYSLVARSSNSSAKTCTMSSNSTEAVMQSAWCYRGTCPG